MIFLLSELDLIHADLLHRDLFVLVAGHG